MSLPIVGHHVFVLLVGLGVFANSGPQAGGGITQTVWGFSYIAKRPVNIV